MRTRRSLVLLTAAMLTGTALLSGGAEASVISRYEVAFWGLNEAPGSTRMIDTSGNGHDGRIGKEVELGIPAGVDGGYRFERLEPDTPPTHPQHLVVVPHSPALNPASNDFAVTVRLRTTNKFGNIIQKGQATVTGGSFKLQIPNGRVECTFRGSKGTMELFAPYQINDGAWHVVRCLRVRDGVAMMIDGQQVASRAGWTGPIANNWPVSIGGKMDCDQKDVGCDYYAGDLDYIFLESVPQQQW
ncbi:laminin G domain-containing protein [Actinoplanes sp. GCM10030250]|uniref:laminin G domain-containing protein n=1 Tax=Actinoplanes sp. GCM10030250 TaxID=3273376 RepID=UPI003620D0FD